MFAEYGYKQSDIDSKVEAAFQQLFYGDSSNQALFYTSSNPPNSGYILSVDSNDVRSEGMSYGMMISVQLNKQKEFDEIFTWAKAHMQVTDSTDPRYGYFAWHCDPTTGKRLDMNPAPDGETWFVTALLFADARWGPSSGRFDYNKEAQLIMAAMLDKEVGKVQDSIYNMFSTQEKQVVFVPYASAANYTDASYHLPSFYQVWADRADKNKTFWPQVVQTARAYFKIATDPSTGLASDYSSFAGAPYGSGNTFHFDAWRVAQNIAMDYAWYAVDDWQVQHSNKILAFFKSQGSSYINHYSMQGKNLGGDHSPGLVAMNCVATLASNTTDAWGFVEDLWNTAVPSGHYRYYDGCLYMLGLLQCAGKFKAYTKDQQLATVEVMV
jgi:oligosaccharide reducing-end xylanase